CRPHPHSPTLRSSPARLMQREPSYLVLYGGCMNLVERVKNILLQPKQEWPKIDAESTDAKSLYLNYVVIMAAIPAIAGFIGLSIVGISLFGSSYRLPIVDGLIACIVRFVMTLVGIFVWALIIDALAPTFNGTKNQIQALKL